MVYCGKPSRACRACRAKKSRCDADPGGCAQCRNAGRVCPGYRDLSELLFRDESAKVIARQKSCQARYNANQVKRTSSTSRESCHPVITLALPLEDRAICYFLSQYPSGMSAPHLDEAVCHDTAGLPGGYSMNVFRAIDQPLSAGLVATSLACFANHTCSPDIEKKSLRFYVEALRMVNQAISSPSNAVKDTTLHAINLLGLYERFSGGTDTSMQTWLKHVQGATYLLRLRGEEQFESLYGRRIFIQTINSILVCCVQWTIRFPEQLIKMIERLAERMHDCGWQLQLLQSIISVNQFRFKVRNKIIIDPQQTIDDALRLDQPLAEFYDQPRPGWEYQVLIAEEFPSDLLYSSSYHIYPSASVASLWNSIRFVRMLLHQHIRQTYPRYHETGPIMDEAPPADSPPQLLRSFAMCRMIRTDILNSAPQQLGYLSSSSLITSRSATDARILHATASHGSSPTNMVSSQPPGIVKHSQIDKSNCECWTDRSVTPPMAHLPALRGYTLMWPLWIAGISATADDQVRRYSAASLLTMGRSMGIKHASVLGRKLEIYDGKTVIFKWKQNDARL